MDKIIFKDITTSALGFGCTKLTDHYSRKEALYCLETCLDSGITHFDTARMYGFGESEIILGDFLKNLKNKRDKVTITTKIGIDPLALPTHSQFMMKLAKDIVNRLPAVKKMISKRTDVFVHRPSLTADIAKKHLAESLTKLKTDYIDILLLHEFDVATANKEELISFFKEKINAGVVRHVGLGSFFEFIKDDFQNLNIVYDVIQTDNSLLNPNIEQLGSKFQENHLTIAFSIFKDFKTIQKFAEKCATQMEKNQRFVQKLKKETQIDLSADKLDKNINRLIIDFMKYTHASGINIFTSTNPQNIKNNVTEWENPTYSREQVLKFVSTWSSYTDELFNNAGTKISQSAQLTAHSS